MKKSYLKNIFLFFITIIVISLAIFYIAALFLKFEIEEKHILTLLQIDFIALVMSFCFSLRSYFVRFDKSGIKKIPLGNNIKWDEIDRIVLIGIPKVNFFNKITFSGNTKSISVDLFIFEDQNKFFEELKNYLPWITGVNSIKVPSEIRKR